MFQSPLLQVPLRRLIAHQDEKGVPGKGLQAHLQHPSVAMHLRSEGVFTEGTRRRRGLHDLGPVRDVAPESLDGPVREEGPAFRVHEHHALREALEEGPSEIPVADHPVLKPAGELQPLAHAPSNGMLVPNPGKGGIHGVVGKVDPFLGNRRVAVQKRVY